MGDDDTTDDDNYSGFSAPSLSAKNVTKHSSKQKIGSQIHGRFDQMNGNFRDLQINVTNSNFDMKEEHHSLYLSDTITGYKPRSSGGRDEDDDSSVGDFVIEKKNASPVRLGKEGKGKDGKSEKGSGVLSIPSALSSPANANRRSTKKSVTFSADTILPREDHLALSITKHLYTRELGFTQYHIQLMYRGVEWTVLKRYRDFSAFHTKLLAENATYQIGLPDLPKKRWFEKQRWLNKFDESYSLHRKNALQDYLRLLAKTPIVKNRFQSFHDFLEIPLDKIKENEDFDAESEQIDFDLAINQHSKYPQEGNHFIHDVSSTNNPSVGYHNRSAQRKHMPDFDNTLLPENDARDSGGGGGDKERIRGGSSESASDYYDEEPDDQGFCYNEPPPAQPYSSTLIYGHNGTNQQPPQVPSVPPGGHHSPHPLKHTRQNHSPPPSRPTHQTNHTYHHNLHGKHHHNNHHNHHHSRTEFRDSILETPLNQQFDDDGEMIISRP